MSNVAEDDGGVAEPSTVWLRILAGPFQAFSPLRFREAQFAGAEGDVELVPLSVDWVPRDIGRPTHEDLAKEAGDVRLDVAARAIREDFSAGRRPVLVLPELSRQVLQGTAPLPGRIPSAEMLRRLATAVGAACLDVRFLAIDGFDDTPARRAALEADLAVVKAHLGRVGLRNIVIAVEAIGASHPGYWRAALNRLTWMGDSAGSHAKHLLSGLTDIELAVAAADHDGRQLLELTPSDGLLGGFEPPTARPVTGGPLVDPTRRIGLNGRKVTFVCEKVAERSGGAERVLVELANSLSRRGYQVEILSHENRTGPPFYPLEFGVVHTNLSPRHSSGTVRDRAMHKVKAALQKAGTLAFPIDRLAFQTRYSAFRVRLAEHIDASRPDVVVPFMPPAIVATALAETTHRPRLVASMHNAPAQDFENPIRWDPGAYARRKRLELMLRMDTVNVLLATYQEWYPPSLRKRTTAVPNAVVPVADELLARAERGSTILAIGRLADAKRHDLLLRAFAELVQEFPDWEVRIFGVGPLFSELVELRNKLALEGRAHILGHTPNIAEEYLSASILCHPARFEGFPLAVTEALASGVPVVGFADCSGVNSLVMNDENGILMDAGDGSDRARLEAMTQALRRLMEDSATRARLGAAGPASMEPYHPERVVDMWEQVLFPH